MSTGLRSAFSGHLASAEAGQLEHCCCWLWQRRAWVPGERVKQRYQENRLFAEIAP